MKTCITYVRPFDGSVNFWSLKISPEYSDIEPQLVKGLWFLVFQVTAEGVLDLWKVWLYGVPVGIT